MPENSHSVPFKWVGIYRKFFLRKFQNFPSCVFLSLFLSSVNYSRLVRPKFKHLCMVAVTIWSRRSLVQGVSVISVVCVLT
jgi:hypothetical protein